MKKLEFQNKTIHYTYSGDGPNLILLHGFLESSTIWKSLITKLSTHFKVVALDLPGHGTSDVIGETHSMELMAEIVESLREKLQLNEISIVGHSMGGYVALAYAELFPQHLKNIILLNSTAIADSPDRIVNRNRAIRLLFMEHTGFISMAINNLFSEKSRQEFSNEIEMLKMEAFSYPVDGIQANIRGMRDRIDRSNVLKSWTKGKYILSGKQDPLILSEDVKMLGESTKTPVKMLDGSHMGWLENEEEIVKFLHFIEFIDT